MMTTEHYGSCMWSQDTAYVANTPSGTIEMFGDDGHRAVELMLMSAAACLNFFLVEYAQARKLPIDRLEVRCDGDIAQRPERVSCIRTHVAIDGDLSGKDAQRMVQICERACKVMNTLRTPPECAIEIDNRQSQRADEQEAVASKRKAKQ